MLHLKTKQMKKLFLVLLSFFALTSYGQAEYEKLKITENISSLTAPNVNVQETDGLINYRPLAGLPFAQSDTGVLTFASPGISVASGTQVSIGAVTGYIVDNETNPAAPTRTHVNYAGETNKTVTTIGGGLSSYIMLSSSGVISFQNTFPTSAERKAKIWLGKVAHPLGVVTVAGAEPDFITSPLSQHRDFFQALGPYINDGVTPYPNGANLSINATNGNIHGDGINFVVSRTNPGAISVVGAPITFLPRTQTGNGGTAVTNVDVGNYDVAGAVTAIPGGGARSTIRYIYYIPNLGFIIQYGQQWYSNLTDAIANVGKEAQTIYPPLADNSILVGVLVARKDATLLNDVSQARFFPASKLGEIIGATSGVSTGTLQTAYNSSLTPQITTSTALGAVTIRRGSTSDADNILVSQNGAGVNTFVLTGSGNVGLNQNIPEASFHIGDGNAIILDRYKNGTTVAPNFLGRAYNGTKISPTTILDNQDIAIFGAIAYNGIDADNSKAWLKFISNGVQSGTNRGTKVDISITPLNSLTPSKSVLNADNDRVLLSDASVVNAMPVAVGWFGKGEVTGENPHKFQVVSDGLNPTVSFGQFGGATAGNSGGHLWASRGTATSPSAIQSGDYLWSWGFRGQGTTTRAPSSANMSVRATENFTDTAQGTEILFGTNATGHDANLGRTSEFKMQSDGGFLSDHYLVESYSAFGKAGSYRFKYLPGQAASRSWRIGNDYDAFGDFAILQSTTQSGTTYAKKFSINPAGAVVIPDLAGAGNAIVLTESDGKLKRGAVQPLRYKALLSQTGTSAPTATVLENTLGATITWTRNTAGNFFGTLSAGVFTANKTHKLGTLGYTGISTNSTIELESNGTNLFGLITKTGGVQTDGVMSNGGTSILIEIYP